MRYKCQEEYFIELAEKLKYLHPNDATKVLKFYQQKISTRIDYGEDEEDVLASLPTPEEVANDAYKSHGIDYLNKRKKQNKRKQILNKIIDTILSLIIVVAFVMISAFLLISTFRITNLLVDLFTLSNTFDLILSVLCVISYILVILLLYVYFIDLIYILLSHFLGNIIKFKNDDQKRKILGFTITGYINEKTKIKQLYLKIIGVVSAVLVVSSVLNFSIKGYIFRSLTDTTSNSEVITLEDVKDINIDVSNAFIDIKKSETNENYIEYKYEFNPSQNISVTDGNLSIKLEKTTAYDLLDILTEPTQRITIYLKETSINNLNCNGTDLNLNITDVTIDNVKAFADTEIKSTLVNTTITDNLEIKCFSTYLGINKCSIGQITGESTKGQFIVEKESQIDNLDYNNGQGYIMLKSSTIDVMNIINSSGTIKGDYLQGTSFTLESKSSKNDFKDLVYDKVNAKVSNTCYLYFSRLITKTSLNVEVKDSYFLVDYLKSKATVINADNGAVLLSNINKNYIENDTYNNYSVEGSLNVKNQGKLSKTELGYSDVNIAEIYQTEGFLTVIDTNIVQSKIVCAKTKAFELNNISGGKMDLYLTLVDSTKITSTKKDIEITVKKYDTLSGVTLEVEDGINWHLEKEE